MRHPSLGLISLEYSSFAIDGRSDLAMVVYNPVTAQDQRVLQSFVLEAKPQKIKQSVKGIAS